MDKEHFLDFFKDAISLKKDHLRLGQAFMIALYNHNRFLYDRVTNTEVDCFFDDSKVVKLIDYLLRLPQEGDGLSGILGRPIGS